MPNYKLESSLPTEDSDTSTDPQGPRSDFQVFLERAENNGFTIKEPGYEVISKKQVLKEMEKDLDDQIEREWTFVKKSDGKSK